MRPYACLWKILPSCLATPQFFETLRQPCACRLRFHTGTFDHVELPGHRTLAGKTLNERFRARRIAAAAFVFHSQVLFSFLRTMTLAITNEDALAAAECTEQVIDLGILFISEQR